MVAHSTGSSCRPGRLVRSPHTGSSCSSQLYCSRPGCNLGPPISYRESLYTTSATKDGQNSCSVLFFLVGLTSLLCFLIWTLCSLFGRIFGSEINWRKREKKSDHNDRKEAIHKFELQKLQEKMQIQALEIKSLKMKSDWSWFCKVLWFISISFAMFVGSAMSGQ